MTKTEKLLQLVKENPDLPIIPMVETEVVCGDEYGYWMGSFEDCQIREFAIDEWYGEGIVRYRDDFNAEGDLIEAVAEGKYEGTDEDYERAKMEVKDMWTKAIIVKIGLPE
jgi:hypothetical protein